MDMKLAKTKRADLIRRFLLNAIKAGNNAFFHDAMEIFGLSRQAIHGHLSALVELGCLAATGNTRGRKYVLGPVRSHIETFQLQGLSESDVYYRDFGFMFKDLPREIENICHYGFTEMLNNAIDHSGGAEVEVFVNRSAEAITISVSDDGEGIFDHIARIMGLHDKRESILELSKGKLTTDPDNHSGQGIFFSSRAFDRFYIESSELVFSHTDGDHHDWLFHDEEIKAGTLVNMRIALNSERTLRSVFDAFTGDEEEDFAFNKTVVPIKLALYEGERLVSRSQGKRILNRVEKFKTVLLDFTGVDSIGQAFADEVFRVFVRQHPEIELIPVHMNEGIRRLVLAAQSGSS
jgi:anti-sigma regulatory factor (Ser/Thr protein kinase)